jgi:branched-chain amino acid transport system substrate-binding protein
MSTRSLRQLALAAVVLVSSGSLAACGSSSKPTSAPAKAASSDSVAGSSQPTTGSTSGPAASGTPIVVGFECSCSGVFASSTAIQGPVISAWAAYENANGGVDGHPLKLIKMDDANNATTSLAQVTKLVEQDHVLAIIDGSNVDSAWATYVQQHNVPVVGDLLDSTPMFTNPDFFPEGQTADQIVNGILAGAKKAGVAKLGVPYCTAVAACANLADAVKQLASAQGISVPYISKIPDDASNYTASCLASKQSGANGVLVGSGETVIEAYAQSCSAQGYDPKYIETETSVSNAVLPISAFEGTVAVEPDASATDTNSPPIQSMIAALNKYEPGTVTSAAYGPGATMAWAAGMLFAAAAQAGSVGSDPTPTALLNGLYSLHGATLNGLTPALTFQPGKPHSVSCFFYTVIHNHQFTTPYGSGSYCS